MHYYSIFVKTKYYGETPTGSP